MGDKWRDVRKKYEDFPRLKDQVLIYGAVGD